MPAITQMLQRNTCVRTSWPIKTSAILCTRLAPNTKPSRKSISTKAYQTSTVMSQQEVRVLTQRILEAEARLGELFQSGRPMPRAAVVSKARQEVADLKNQLSLLVSNNPELAGQTDDQAIQAARQLIAGVHSTNSTGYAEEYSEDYNIKLALLEAENQMLREQARNLLMRLQDLEECAQKMNISYRPHGEGR